jgi:hypothetical protein
MLKVLIDTTWHVVPADVEEQGGPAIQRWMDKTAAAAQKSSSVASSTPHSKVIDNA